MVSPGHIELKVLIESQMEGLVQDGGNSIANALELPQSWTKPSRWSPDECIGTSLQENHCQRYV